MKCILGIKNGMTQCFDDQGICYPATVLKVDPVLISGLKTKEKDGYEALQIAAFDQKPERLTKADRGHQQSSKKTLREFRLLPRETLEGLEKGQELNAGIFTVGDKVSVSAISKGKGFQGVVKRHNFAGGPKTHGQKHSHRAPGSIGSTDRARVEKGKKMAGRMGGNRITVKNLDVLQVNIDENTLLIKGAIPGRNGAVVEVRKNA